MSLFYPNLYIIGLFITVECVGCLFVCVPQAMQSSLLSPLPDVNFINSFQCNCFVRVLISLIEFPFRLVVFISFIKYRLY